MSNIATAVKIGDIVEGTNEVRELEAGTKLLNLDDFSINTRLSSGFMYFEEGTPASGKFVVVALPKPEAPLNLRNREVLAQELLRVRTHEPSQTLEDAFAADRWLEVADFVLKAFGPLEVGDRVVLVHDEKHYVGREDLIGEEGRVDNGLDSDGDLYVVFDKVGYGYFVKPDQLRKV